MALSEADRTKLWERADGRCSICKRSVTRPESSGASDALIAVERPMRVAGDAAAGGLVLVGGFLDSYDNHMLLCEADSELLRRQADQYAPARLEWLKAKHEERPNVAVSLTVHTAMFMPTSPSHYFLKIRNWSREVPIQLNRVWFATDPAVTIDNDARPLPTLIAPGDLFETWIPTRRVPVSANIDFLARAEFEDGLIVESQPNPAVAPSGVVGGGGQPLTSLIASVAAINHVSGQLIDKEWDVFISHASQDKVDVVEPLAIALRDRGLRVWYDRFEMHVGDSLRRKIDEGIARSAFGVVVLSPHFFTKRWTNHEMDGLMTRAVAGGQVLLPVWHNVTQTDVERYSPSLADKIACNTLTTSIEGIADLIDEVVKGATRA